MKPATYLQMNRLSDVDVFRLYGTVRDVQHDNTGKFQRQNSRPVHQLVDRHSQQCHQWCDVIQPELVEIQKWIRKRFVDGQLLDGKRNRLSTYLKSTVYSTSRGMD
jgi:hypothetical protein